MALKDLAVTEAPKTPRVSLSCWLTFDRNGIRKMYKSKPALHAGEKTMKVNLSVPTSVFKEPDLIANVVLEGDPPPEHRMELVADVKEALDSIPHIFVSVPPATDDE